MAPKGKPKKEEALSPSDALASVMVALEGAEGAISRAAAVEPLVASLSSDASAVATLTREPGKIDPLLSALVGVIDEATAEAEAPSPELVAAVATCSTVLCAIIDGSSAACGVFLRLSGLNSLLSCLTPPPPPPLAPPPTEEMAEEEAAPPMPPPGIGSWSGGVDEARASLFAKLVDLLASVAAHAEGRAHLRRAEALPLLVELLQPPLAAHAALQVSAATALSRAIESALARAVLGLPHYLPSLLALVPQLASSNSLTDPPMLRRHSKLMWSLGFCLYDGKMRRPLLDAGLIDTAIQVLRPPPLPEGVEVAPELPVEVQAGLGELQANAAIVIAIGAQSAEGRGALLAVPSSLRILVDSLQLPIPDDRPVHSDPLLANVSLAIAHAALSTPAAARLIALGAVAALLPLIMPLADGDNPPQSSPVRGNACTALLHLCHQPEGRVLLLKESQSLPSLIALVSDPDGDPSLTAVAIDVMGELADLPEGRTALLASGALLAALPLLSLDHPPHVVEATVAMLAAVGVTPVGCAALRGQFPPLEETAPGSEAEERPPPPVALEAIPSLLGEGSIASLRRAAAGLVAAACNDKENAQTLVALGCLSPLLSLAQDPASGVSSAAANAVSAMCNSLSSVQLWHRAELSMITPIDDGFYSVTRDCELLTVEQLKQLPLGGSEVVLVDSASDPAFAADVEQAMVLAEKNREAGNGATSLASVLAVMVADRLGGAIEYDRYELLDLSGEIGRLMAAHGSRVLPIGALRRGTARHRALLYKALADRVGLSVGLHVGKCLRGAHAHHSWNSFVDDGKLTIVDVLHSPGEMYEDGSERSLQYKRIDKYAFSSLVSTNLAYNKPSTMPVAVK